MARFRKELIGKRDWQYGAAEEDSFIQDQIESLAKTTGLSQLCLRICWQRGLQDAESIQRFLSPSLEHLTSPFLIQDMDRAVERLVALRSEGGRLRVFGDYDVDGTCAAALLFRFFNEIQLPCDVEQPDRFKDGYGLNKEAIERAKNDEVNVLVTVDCGITSFEAAELAREYGIDLIVVDHHQIDPKRGLPVAQAVVNPQREDCQSGLKQLCGCGLAFYLAMSLRSKGRELGWFQSIPMPNLKQYLDLVVLATAADMVPLTGDNRILVKHGLDVLRQTQKPGLKALLDVAGIRSRDVSPGHLGFTLGPRINASGRMASAGMALRVLTTSDPEEGLKLARDLEALNRERADIQNQIWDEVRSRVEAGLEAGKFQHAVVLGDPNWHEGVVGIVASKVTEVFHKPAVILSMREDMAKGSVRSYGGKNVLQALRSCSHLLMGFGGHKMAAGLSLDFSKVEELASSFDQAIAEQESKKSLSPIRVDGQCSVDDLSLGVLREIEKLAPFGPGNPEPIFQLSARVQGKRVLKQRHLKMFLVDQGDSVGATRTLDAIWFNAAEDQEVLDKVLAPQTAQWVGVPEINRFRGQETPNFRVYDWRETNV